VAARDRAFDRAHRHGMIPGPVPGGILLLHGREPGWSYRAWPNGTCTVRFRIDPAEDATAFSFVRALHPSVLARMLAAAGNPAAARASARLRTLCGGAEATRRADRALARWTREDALAFAGPDGAALASRIREARALPLLNLPLPDPENEILSEAVSPAWTYGSLDPLAIGRRARTRTGRWPASDARLARLVRGQDPIEGLPLLCALASLPEDWDRGAPGEREALKALAEATAPLARLLGHFDFLAPAKGRWSEHLAALGGPHVLAARVSDALDMLRAFARQVVVPALARSALAGDLAPTARESPSTAVAALLLADGKGLGALLELSEAWHVRRRILDAAAESPSDEEDGERWPVPFPVMTAPNGVMLTCLATALQLRDEGDAGRGLAHCVGGYVDACATGRSVILSLREPASAGGRRLSTLELTRRGGVLTLAQHRGRANANPPPEAAEAADWLCRELAAGRLAASREYLGHAWRQRLGSRPYDPRSDRAFARAVGAWSPLLRRPLRAPRALEIAAVEACGTLVDRRVGPGERPLLGPLGLLTESGLALYPPPLRGDLLVSGRIHAVDGLRAALGVALRRFPPGLRDVAEPYLAILFLVLPLPTCGLAVGLGLDALGASGWVSAPAALVLGPVLLAAAVLRPPFEGRRRVFARRLARARGRLGAGGLRRGDLA